LILKFGRRRVKTGWLCGAMVAIFVYAAGGNAAANGAAQAASGQASGTAAKKAPAVAQTAKHALTVTFDYDFGKNVACSDVVQQKCVAKFRVYDISLPTKKYLLYTIAVPVGATGMMKGISGTSPEMTFVVGQHRIGVAAVTADNLESNPLVCQTVIVVGE
jgi:hypothetical protein